MQRFSDSLMDLARWVRRLEDSASAAQAKTWAAPQARRDELETAIEHDTGALHTATQQARQADRSWWSDTRASIARQIGQIRADFEKWQAGMKEKNAERARRRR